MSMPRKHAIFFLLPFSPSLFFYSLVLKNMKSLFKNDLLREKRCSSIGRRNGFVLMCWWLRVFSSTNEKACLMYFPFRHSLRCHKIHNTLDATATHRHGFVVKRSVIIHSSHALPIGASSVSSFGSSHTFFLYF